MTLRPRRDQNGAPDPDRDSDDDLLARTARGDAQAFALLFRRRHAQVYRFALHMTGTAGAADDVTQDVFIVVMKDAVRYQPGRSGVAAWLCGIARNCARQRLERDRPYQALSEDDDALSEAAPQADPLGDLTRAEGIERVRKAVLNLPIRYREVIVLCDLQEMSYAEAADVLACAVGTVRSRLHRGRQLLATKLSASEPSGEGTRSPVKPRETSEKQEPARRHGADLRSSPSCTRTWA
jgi:RNA polymerase sigma-70 factor (ECF subfamily)